MTFKHLLASTLCLLPATAALAQDTHTSGVAISDINFATADLFVTDVSVLDGNLCIGNSCLITETFTNDTLVKLSSSNLSMLFDDSSNATFPDRDWRLLVNDVTSIASGGIERFSIEDVTAGTIPFTVLGGAPANAFWMDTWGQIGMGTMLPQADLHVARTDNTAQILVEDTGASGAQEMFRLANNGGSYFTFDNTAAGTTWFFVHEDASPNRFLITDGVAGGGPELALNAAGDLTVKGELFTSGACAAGCDRVFDADYPLPTIAEQAAMMTRDRHLPAVGPTPEDGPFNITRMTGGMLNELEKAHLYIAELEARLSMIEARLAQMP